MLDYYNSRNTLNMNKAQMRLGVGQHMAQLAQNAAQYDLDYNSKAHAAREQAMDLGNNTIIGFLRQMYKDRSQYDLYQQMLKNYYQA